MSEVPAGPQRNHPIAIVNNLFVVVVFLVIALISIPLDQFMKYLVPIVAILAVIAALIVRFWQTTTIEFNDESLRVRRNFISKTDRTVPYSRVAAVNINRSFFDRIAGTATVQFNINSAINAGVADVSFVFKQDRAAAIRDFIYTRAFRSGSQQDRDEEHQSLVHFSAGQVLAHCYLSQPTWSLVWGLFWLGFSVLSVIYGSTGGVITGLLLLAIQEIVPQITMFLRFYNFRAYRDGQTIVIQNGLIQTYRTEFDISKINTVRLRQPMLARYAHRTCLEAEVVGINGSSQDTTPTLCLLMPETAAYALMKQLIPEFVTDLPAQHEPKTAEKTMFIHAVIADVLMLAVCAYPVWLLAGLAPIAWLDAGWMPWIHYMPAVFLAVGLFYPFWIAWRSYRLLQVSFGEDRLTMYRGRMDREWVIVPYDRIQLTCLSGSLIARHYGLCHLTVNILSTVGGKEIKSGLFPEEVLAEVPETVQARIRDGRYDPHITGI